MNTKEIFASKNFLSARGMTKMFMVVALIAFSFPFLTVSCGEANPIEVFTGYDLAFGTEFFLFYRMVPVPGNMLIVMSILFAVVTFVAAFLSKYMLSKLIWFLSSAAGMTCSIIYMMTSVGNAYDKVESLVAFEIIDQIVILPGAGVVTVVIMFGGSLVMLIRKLFFEEPDLLPLTVDESEVYAAVCRESEITKRITAKGVDKGAAAEKIAEALAEPVPEPTVEDKVADLFGESEEGKEAEVATDAGEAAAGAAKPVKEEKVKKEKAAKDKKEKPAKEGKEAEKKAVLPEPDHSVEEKVAEFLNALETEEETDKKAKKAEGKAVVKEAVKAEAKVVSEPDAKKEPAKEEVKKATPAKPAEEKKVETPPVAKPPTEEKKETAKEKHPEPKAEVAKKETPKAETPKVEATKAEAPKAEAPKAEKTPTPKPVATPVVAPVATPAPPVAEAKPAAPAPAPKPAPEPAQPARPKTALELAMEQVSKGKEKVATDAKKAAASEASAEPQVREAGNAYDAIFGKGTVKAKDLEKAARAAKKKEGKDDE